MEKKLEVSSDALTPAVNLRNNSIQMRSLREQITEIIKRLDDELKNSHHEGRHYIITSIPITFDIPNMTNKDSQRIIWSKIIQELKSKDYRVWIQPSNSVCRLKITWMRTTDDAEIILQTKTIADHTKEI
jgi:hypothetical protein